MTYLVEMIYPTVMGGLKCNYTTGHEVATMADAEAVRDKLRQLVPSASVAIKNGRPPKTIDEAVGAFVDSLREYPVRAS